MRWRAVNRCEDKCSYTVIIGLLPMREITKRAALTNHLEA